MLLEKFKNLETKHKVIVIAVIVLIVALIIYFIYKRNKKSSSSLVEKTSNKNVSPVSYRDLEKQVDEEYEKKNNSLRVDEDENESSKQSSSQSSNSNEGKEKIVQLKPKEDKAKVVSMDNDPALKKVETE